MGNRQAIQRLKNCESLARERIKSLGVDETPPVELLSWVMLEILEEFRGEKFIPESDTATRRRD